MANFSVFLLFSLQTIGRAGAAPRPQESVWCESCPNTIITVCKSIATVLITVLINTATTHRSCIVTTHPVYIRAVSPIQRPLYAYTARYINELFVLYRRTKSFHCVTPPVSRTPAVGCSRSPPSNCGAVGRARRRHRRRRPRRPGRPRAGGPPRGRPARARACAGGRGAAKRHRPRAGARAPPAGRQRARARGSAPQWGTCAPLLPKPPARALASARARSRQRARARVSAHG